ncbi:Gamma-tubulin complex component 2 [Galdieria sulphuraria]|uniref:Spindle pole body component n=1 Tax=Galdieria sulphuraria TaxID=130081 RepID=M2Y2C0_GALSU|nr:tubulin family protein [Galdieria sulphuraria]EME30108.1 tubulin family protein [Galdieria sulphuraria]GJD11571.1 Gamma-tubulin complex component 2 [Galdieria sulphuraria]|eukprot:XP_005706628.1 tubulin family protein [Galdieria sulphuraria]
MSESNTLKNISSPGKADLSPGKYRERLHQILSKVRASQEQVYSPLKNTPSPLDEKYSRHSRTVSVDVSSAGLPRPSSRRLSFEKVSPVPPISTEDIEDKQESRYRPKQQQDVNQINDDSKSSYQSFKVKHHSRSQSLIEKVVSTNTGGASSPLNSHSKHSSRSSMNENNYLPSIREENVIHEDELPDDSNPMNQLPELLEQLEKTPQLRTYRKSHHSKEWKNTPVHQTEEELSIPPTTPISSEPTLTKPTTWTEKTKKDIRRKKGGKRHYPTLPTWFKDTFRDSRSYSQDNVCHNEKESSPPLFHMGLPTAAMEFLISEDLLYALLGISGKMTSYLESIRSLEQQHAMTCNPAINLGCRILPLADDLSRIQSFIDDVTYESGLVKQATCGVLKSLIHEYYRRIVSIESLLRRGELSLQTLWLSLQPCFRTMAVLRRIVDALNHPDIRGSLALGTLHSITLQLQGDPDAYEVATNIMRVAFQPMIDFLSLWLNSGVIYDPFEEFFITEQEKYKGWEPGEVVDDSFWELRFILRKSQVPSLFRGIATKILTSGKYKCVMKALLSKSYIEHSSLSYHPFIESEEMPQEDILDKIFSSIENCFMYSSKELFDVLCQRFQLLSFLGFLKHYLLLSQADFLGFFLDFAREELNKPIATISTESLNALLELSIRSCCNFSEMETQKDALFCRLMPQSLTSQLLRIIHLNDTTDHTTPGKDEIHDKDIFGYEAFCLDCHIPFPLSIVISKRMLTKYQLVFRHLFACKMVHRKLEDVWILLKTQRSCFRDKWISNSYILFHRMIHFLDSVLYYDFMEVIEPNWKAMELALKTGCDKLEVANRKHNDFLDTILKQCMLTNPKLLRTQSKLLNACVMFCSCIQDNINWQLLYFAFTSVD